MPRQIVTTSPDVEAWLLEQFESAVAGASVNTLRPDEEAPYRQLVIRADLQGKVTPITRYCRIGIQAWATRAGGEADLPQALADCAALARAIEAAGTTAPLVAAEINAGPYRVVDAKSGLEFAAATVLTEISVA